MRKFLSVLLALAIVCSFGVCAFAAVSPVGVVNDEGAGAGAVVPVATVPAETVEEAILSSVKATGAEDKVVDIEIKTADDENLTEEEAAALEEAVAAIEDKAVVAAFILKTDAEVSESSPLAFSFECEGENVGVQVNGNEMAVEAVETVANGYVASLTETGAVVIYRDEA